MAELLGVIASGMSVVSLAIQVAESIQKLRSFYSLMRSAPSEILLLLDELETLSLILEDIDSSIRENVFLDPRTRVAVLKSYGFCRRTGEALVVLVKDLEEGVERRRGRLKVALKKERIEEVRRKLESSKMTMVLAKQCYHEAIARQNWESFERDMLEMKATMGRISEQRLLSVCAGSSRVDESRRIEDEAADKEESAGQKARDPSEALLFSQQHRYGWVTRQKGMKKFSGLLDIVVSGCGSKTATSISLSLPTWIHARKYELCMMKSRQGWDQTFRSYRVVSYDAPVFHLSMTGDVAGLQQLFEAGQASPFEVDPEGRTPLHYAALYARPNVCNFLLDNGADANVRTSWLGEFNLDRCMLHRLGRNRRQPRGMPAYSTPLHFLAFNGAELIQNGRQVWGRSHFDSSAIEDDFYHTLCSLVAKGQCDTFHKDQSGSTVFHAYTGPSTIFRWLKLHEEVQISSLSVDEMHELLCTRLDTHWVPEIENLREIFPGGQINENLAQNFSKPLAYSFMAANMLSLVSQAWVINDLRDDGPMGNLIKDVIKAGSDLHPLLGCYSRTTLLLLIHSLLFSCFPTAALKCYLRRWLHILVEAGVDLVEFGRIENDLHDENKVSWFFDIKSASCGELDIICIMEMLELRIGPRPEDIYIEFEDLYVSTGLAADFWLWAGDSLELGSEVEVMPGAWYSDD